MKHFLLWPLLFLALVARVADAGTLVEAAYDGKLKEVEAHVSAGIPIDVIQEPGLSALSAAAFSGQYPVAKWLIEAGASIDLPAGQWRNTPLLYALSPMVTLDAVVDPAGAKALETARAWEKRRIVALLLNHGASVTYKNDLGDTALTIACAGGDIATPLIIKNILRRDAGIDAINRFGRTALMQATFYRKHQLMSVLLDRGADVAIADDQGRSALDIALAHDDEIAVALICRRSRAGVARLTECQRWYEKDRKRPALMLP